MFGAFGAFLELLNFLLERHVFLALPTLQVLESGPLDLSTS